MLLIKKLVRCLSISYHQIPVQLFSIFNYIQNIVAIAIVVVIDNIIVSVIVCYYCLVVVIQCMSSVAVA